ncbi:MAG: chemotaxis protein, partial [Cyanobacteria bacterium J06648_11]
MTATPTQANGKLNQPPEDALDLFTRAAELEREHKLEEARVLYQQVATSDEDFLRESALKALENLETMGVSAPAAAANAEGETIFRGRTIVSDEAAPEATAAEVAQIKRQGFANLPLLSKQLVSVIGVQLISVLAVSGVGGYLINQKGNQQLQQQAQSELAVTDIGYNIKINQMGFGFRGQSDNAAIVAAASAAEVTPELRESVTQILQNEISARTIEYATLVDRDRRIIASANADRVGELFDPNALVTQLFDDPEREQIKASQIVSWSELQAEQPPLPEGVEGQPALIRYTVTPVEAENSDEVVGALVSGDIVNGKLPIPTGTNGAFDGGYAAVYAVMPDGRYELVSSQLGIGDDANEMVALPSLSALDKASAAPDGIGIDTTVIDGQPFAVAARVLKDEEAGAPVAFIVRGTPKAQLNQILQDSRNVQVGVALLLLVAGIIVAYALARSIATPVRNLQQTSRSFS